MTFSQLAEKMNVSINDINAWFLAKKEIPFFHLDALSQLFGCNAQWLKHGVGAAYNQIVLQHIHSTSTSFCKRIFKY
ncbi:helix-turn-helix domain-containing protein [Pasteurella bettyae]|uniref:helix-turn-helix domain-containing protein n=1 Tax=Pasteurella bettyae TaxID=752 RepID=UPI0021159739|nr:helix-turn-helix transcriptional regulator [Pasteurella bettyae]